MKEHLEAVEQANEFVVKVEDNWLLDQTAHVTKMRERAEKSNTTITWNEFHSSEVILFEELERLTPPVDKRMPNNPNRRKK